MEGFDQVGLGLVRLECIRLDWVGIGLMELIILDKSGWIGFGQVGVY